MPIDSTAPVPVDLASAAGVEMGRVSATAGGAVELTATNPTSRAMDLQCTIEALGPNGASVLEGTYEAADRAGREYEANAYATRFPLAADGVVTFGVDLKLTSEAARYEADCWEVDRRRT